MNAEENQQSMQTFHNNMAFNSASALAVKLDTNSVAMKFESYLRGQKEIMKKDDLGNDVPVVILIGEPKCNELGIQSIMAKLLTVFNPQVGQGNLKKEHYQDFIYHYRMEVSSLIVENCYKWDIQEGDLDFLIDDICDLAELFLTRPIDNLERESNAQQIKSMESHITRAGGSSWFPHVGRREDK